MKKLYFLLILLLLFSFAAGCENTNPSADRTEVQINMPQDDSVNGYRTEQKESDSMPEVIDGSNVTAGEIMQTLPQSSGYVASKNSKTFHKSGCSSAESIKKENRIFNTREYFANKGYKPCKKCKP